MTEYLLCTLLFCAGLYGVTTRRSMLKMIISLAVMGYGINLFIVVAGFRDGGSVPVLGHGDTGMPVDPLAQVMVMATVVTGLAVTILLSAVAIKLSAKRSTADITTIRDLKG